MPHPKPHVLLLHGGGTSSEIFRFQTRNIAPLLAPHFTLHYLDGPFISPPGPGVLPVFEGMEPYFSWRRRPIRDAAASMTESDWNKWEQEERMVDELVDGVLKGIGGGPGEGFVGVIGFSQGAGLAARLLYRQQCRREREGRGRVSGEDLRFGVFVCGTADCLYSRDRPPPSRTSPAAATAGNASTRTGSGAPGALQGEKEASDIVTHEKIHAKTVHVHGMKDSLLRLSRVLLKEFCDEKVASLVEFDGGHHMPFAKKDNERLAELILRAASE